MKPLDRLFLTALFALSLCSCGGGDHELFNAGHSDYTIVVDTCASECVQYAARELQKWIGEVGSVTLPIGDLSSGSSGHRLIVGSGLQKPDGALDSFTYQSKGGDIYLWGNTDRGTLYSVYSFLEKELGCRWYTSRVSLAPEKDKWSFTKIHNHEVPGIRMRNDFYWDVIYHQDFATKLRSNSTLFGPISQDFGGSENYWGGHSLVSFVSVNEWFDTHPEYFSEIDGKRIKDQAQLCLSNPEVLQKVIEAVRRQMREHPEYLVYSVSQGDWYNPCQCSECKKIKAQYGGEESGILLWFVNQVADAVKDEFPDKFIGTFAYQYSRRAPKNIKPRDNVVIRLCSIEECQIHKYDECDRNRAFLEDLDDWSAIAPHLYIWDYSTGFSNYMLPMPNVWTFQDRIQRFRDGNAIGIMPEGSYQGPANAFEDLKAYVLAKLMWNPDCDVDAVIEDFTDGFFGEAAGPVIREYMQYEKETCAPDSVHQICYPWEDSEMYSDEFVAEGLEYFKRAKDAVRAAGGPLEEEYINRVEYAEVALCYLELMRDPAKGVADGAYDLFKRVAEREGINQIRESGFWVDDFKEEIFKKTGVK